MKEFNRKTLQDHRENIERAEAAAEKAKADRDRFIRGMVETDWHPTAIAEVSGLTRARVYQIRDGRR